MKNAKTTIFGLIAALAGFVSFSPDLFSRWPWMIAVAKYVMAGGMAGIGFAAKDSTSHSTAAEVHAATVSQEIKVETPAVAAEPK
jgi:hypothetical protein